MNIVLIGYRGTGKSVVGRIVAERLAMSCVSMDARIVEQAGMPVPEIVDQFGWPGFRDRESDVARELGALDNLVIDCGGGVIERPANIEALRANGHVFWLRARVGTIVPRIRGDNQRPSLTGAKSFTEEVAEVLDRRTPLYEAAADHAIDTDELTPGEVADRILDLFMRD